MGNEAGDGRAAGVVRAQDLAQKDPERDERRIDSVFPNYADRRESLCNEVFGENIGERQISVLQKLASQKLHLVPKSSLVRMAHAGLLASDGVVASTINASKARFAYVILSERFAAKLSAIRPPNRRRFYSETSRPTPLSRPSTSAALKTAPGGAVIAIRPRRPRRPTKRTVIRIPSTSTTRIWPSPYHSID
jgi:hypothetical protein